MTGRWCNQACKMLTYFHISDIGCRYINSKKAIIAGMLNTIACGSVANDIAIYVANIAEA